MDDLKLEERLKRIEALLVANKEVLTLEEACEYTGISRSYMYKLTSAGKIPHSKPRRKSIYFEKKQLNSWLLGNPKP
jgi:excisionase family DNA binding protein